MPDSLDNCPFVSNRVAVAGFTTVQIEEVGTPETGFQDFIGGRCEQSVEYARGYLEGTNPGDLIEVSEVVDGIGAQNDQFTSLVVDIEAGALDCTFTTDPEAPGLCEIPRSAVRLCSRIGNSAAVLTCLE